MSSRRGDEEIKSRSVAWWAYSQKSYIEVEGRDWDADRAGHPKPHVSCPVERIA